MKGARPTAARNNDNEPGEWGHGWQFFANDPLEQHEFDTLLGGLAGDESADMTAERSARLRFCTGRGSSTWLISMPSTQLLQLTSSQFLTAVRLWLGLPLAIPDEEWGIFRSNEMISNEMFSNQKYF